MRPQLKQVIAIEGRAITNGATSTGVIDTIGADWMTVDVKTSTSNNTTNNPATLQLLEADVNAFSSAATIEGSVGDSDWTIPVGQTAAVWGVKFNVDLRGRKRFVFAEVSPTTTMDIDVVANLGINEQAPIDATKANVRALVEL